MSGEFEVENYGAFQDATETTEAFDNTVEENNDTIETLKTELNNESVFMGPICDSAIDGFERMNQKMEDISSDLGTTENYLETTSTAYQAADNAANSTITSYAGGGNSGGGYVGGGVATGGTAVVASAGTASSSGSSNSNVTTGKANVDTIYSYLAKQGFNDAAICGILANIEKESNFNPTSLGDRGTSYGICQWHNERWTRLKNYCAQNGLNSSSVEGQVSYLVWELKNKYPSVYNKIISVPNTAQGAYNAAYEWTVHFEVPANKHAQGQTRGNLAVSKYWSTYNK